MMLNVPLLKLDRNTPIESISSALDNLDKNKIAIAPWPEFGDQPEVSFTTAHGNDCLFLKYFVKENFIRANYGRINDPVYKDTCVEFFVAFGKDDEYYNFEFNCLGICLAAFGAGRNDRQKLPEGVITRIKKMALIKANSPNMEWQLTLMIPVEVFCHHVIIRLPGLTCKANFYKCGDELPQPHYLSWHPIESAQPDFHLSAFFGRVVFG